MQLTPRGLVMAGTAMLVGGGVFGILTSLAPTATVTDPTPTPSASTSWSDAELGDQVTTYPSSSSSLTATPSTAPATARAAGGQGSPADGIGNVGPDPRLQRMPCSRASVRARRRGCARPGGAAG